MSALRNIVVAMVAFQLALLVINQIEIIPGVRMVTGQINNPSANLNYQLMNATMLNMNIVANGGSTTNQSVLICPFDYVIGGYFINSVSRICYNYQTRSQPSSIERVINFLVSIITLICLGLIWILALIWGATFGSIGLYTSLFSLLDPVLGAVLGFAIGSIQAVLVLWYTVMLIAGLWGGGGEK